VRRWSDQFAGVGGGSVGGGDGWIDERIKYKLYVCVRE
jgi:hypothetical protein